MQVINGVIIFFDTLEVRMDIDNMKAYVTVAELKSLSAAAIKMNHLQSNMTAKIKKIEAHYGQQLFIRVPKAWS